jgi:PST family polysaccharide transporter
MTKYWRKKPIPDYFDNDHLRQQLSRHAVRGGGASVASRATGFGIQMLGVMVLARLLDPSDFGLVAMVTAITEVFYVFKDLGLSYATIQESRINHDQVSTLFWINLSFGIIVTILIMLISPAIAWFYHTPQLRLITVILSVNFLFIGLSTQHLALLKRNMKFISVAVVEITAALTSTVLAIILAWQGWGYWSLVARPLTLGLITTLGVWFFCRWRPGRPIRKSGVRPMLKFGVNTLVGYLFDYITLNLDKTLIGRKFGSDQIGYYQRAGYLSKIASDTLTMSLTNVAVATLSKLRNEPNQYRRYYLKGLSIISFIGMPLSVFMFIMSKDIVHIILGPKWDQTATIFSALGLGTGMYLIYNTNGWLHISLGRSDRFKRWAMIGTVVYVAAIFIGLAISVMGVAIAYTAATFLLTIPCLLYAGKPIGLEIGEILSNLWRPVSAAALSGILCRPLLFKILPATSAPIHLIFCLTIYGLVYLALVILFFGSLEPIKEYLDLLKGMRRHVK